MNEDRLAQTWKDQVRLARQVLAMQTEPIAHAVRQTPHRQFRAGVFAFHGLHCAPSDFWRFHIQRLMNVLQGPSSGRVKALRLLVRLVVLNVVGGNSQ